MDAAKHSIGEKMKRSLITAVLGVSLFLMPFAGLAATGEVKIAYVDLQEALNSSDAGKKAKEVFKVEVDRLQGDLDKRQDELKKVGEELEKQGYLLSDETRAKKERDYQEKIKEFQRFYQDSQEKLQGKDAQLTKKILIDLRSIISKIGQDGGYSMIFEMSEGKILYAPKALDLTSEVIKIYNESSK